MKSESKRVRSLMTKFEVEFYQTADGRKPVKDFLLVLIKKRAKMSPFEELFNA